MVVGNQGRLPLLLLFIAFVVTFLFIRLSVRMIRANVRWWPGNVQPGGVHIHHVVFGIIFVMVAGVGGFTTIGDERPWAEIFAVLFGVGAALVLDEFALVLHLRDVYWTAQGRTSVNAVFLAVALIGLLALGVAPLGVENTGPAIDYVWAILPNAILVILTLLKGKVWTGLIGILVPILVLVGAIRLARPDSPWARWRYRPDGTKAERANRRDERIRTRWITARDRVQDALAGRPG